MTKRKQPDLSLKAMPSLWDLAVDLGLESEVVVPSAKPGGNWQFGPHLYSTWRSITDSYPQFRAAFTSADRGHEGRVWFPSDAWAAVKDGHYGLIDWRMEDQRARAPKLVSGVPCEIHSITNRGDRQPSPCARIATGTLIHQGIEVPGCKLHIDNAARKQVIQAKAIKGGNKRALEEAEHFRRLERRDTSLRRAQELSDRFGLSVVGVPCDDVVLVGIDPDHLEKLLVAAKGHPVQTRHQGHIELGTDTNTEGSGIKAVF